ANRPTVEWYGWQASPWEQDTSHPFIQGVMTQCDAVLGRPTRFQGVPAGVDTRFAGYFGMPAVSCGPVAERIHGANERVHVPSIVATAKIVASTVLDWCGAAE